MDYNVIGYEHTRHHHDRLIIANHDTECTQCGEMGLTAYIGVESDTDLSEEEDTGMHLCLKCLGKAMYLLNRPQVQDDEAMIIKRAERYKNEIPKMREKYEGKYFKQRWDRPNNCIKYVEEYCHVRNLSVDVDGYKYIRLHGENLDLAYLESGELRVELRRDATILKQNMRLNQWYDHKDTNWTEISKKEYDKALQICINQFRIAK